MEKINFRTNIQSQQPLHRSESGDFFISRAGYLSLEDGTVVKGVVPREQSETGIGEVVFTTGMTGYVESLTDPSYAGQILVFTYPLIGNYGVDLRSAESDRIQVNGVIVSEAAVGWSHSHADRSLLTWLQSEHIPILMDVDTRALTKHLRIHGTMRGALSKRSMVLNDMAVQERQSPLKKPIVYQPKQAKTVILVDCGVKENIIRSLMKLPITIKRVPYDYDYTHEAYDGILLSNGPGDPTDYVITTRILMNAMKQDKPIFGICLGSQILGLAAGASTYKLPFGHRGHNQPCLVTADAPRAYITSQNHGYAIKESSLPKGWKVLFRNINDGSVEGITHGSKPFFAVQFHPEACPGPTDTQWLFERFYTSL